MSLKFTELFASLRFSGGLYFNLRIVAFSGLEEVPTRSMAFAKNGKKALAS